MNKIVFLVPLLLCACATNSDITNIQVQIDGIKADVINLKEKSSQSLALSKAAYITSNRAVEGIETALAEIKLTNEKLDKLSKN